MGEGNKEGADPRKFKILLGFCLCPNLTEMETFLAYDYNVMEGAIERGEGGVLSFCHDAKRSVI
jgi:hypothetical protein